MVQVKGIIYSDKLTTTTLTIFVTEDIENGRTGYHKVGSDCEEYGLKSTD